MERKEFFETLGREKAERLKAFIAGRAAAENDGRETLFKEQVRAAWGNWREEYGLMQGAESNFEFLADIAKWLLTVREEDIPVEIRSYPGRNLKRTEEEGRYLRAWGEEHLRLVTEKSPPNSGIRDEMRERREDLAYIFSYASPLAFLADLAREMVFLQSGADGMAEGKRRARLVETGQDCAWGAGMCTVLCFWLLDAERIRSEGNAETARARAELAKVKRRKRDYEKWKRKEKEERRKVRELEVARCLVNAHMSATDTAKSLGISRRTVSRIWESLRKRVGGEPLKRGRRKDAFSGKRVTGRKEQRAFDAVATDRWRENGEEG